MDGWVGGWVGNRDGAGGDTSATGLLASRRDSRQNEALMREAGFVLPPRPPPPAPPPVPVCASTSASAAARLSRRASASSRRASRSARRRPPALAASCRAVASCAASRGRGVVG